MSMRHCMAANLTPLMLRLALGAVFIWAGYSKVAYTDTVTGPQAEALARAGMITPDNAVSPPAGATGETPGNAASPDDVTPDQPAADVDDGVDGELEQEVEEAGETVEEVAEQAAAELEQAADEVEEGLDEGPGEREAAAAAIDTTKSYRIKRLEGLGGAMQGAIDRGQWPGFASSTGAIRGLAWAAAITELLCGVLILVGLLTRLSALGLAGVMVGAVWMTQIGPWLGKPDAFLGFLPDPQLADAANWTKAWKDLLFQFTLLMAAIGVFFSGAGRASLDGIIFREKRERARSED